MSLTMSRRSMLAGFLSTLAAPAVVKADMLMPIKMWRYGPRPTVLAPGILLCDGAEVERSAYPDLFTDMGTEFGPGDGKYTFLLPKGGNSLAIFAGRNSLSGGVMFNTVGSSFDLDSNLLYAQMEDFPERKIDWTYAARRLMRERGIRGSYEKAEFIAEDIREREEGDIRRENRWLEEGLAKWKALRL